MFCPRPFEQFYVTEDGNVHLCCKDWINTPAGNILTTPPLEIWSGCIAQDIRKSILDQSFSHCKNCPLLPGPCGCVVDSPIPKNLSTDRIKVLTLAHDPTCNLSCPSCRLLPKKEESKSRIVQETLVSSGIFSLVDVLGSSGSGDPLASPLFWELLTALNVTEYSHLLLSLQTNGLMLTETAWSRLKDLGWDNRIDEVLLSVDAATAETYLTNRGGRWDVLQRNLDGIVSRKIPLQLNMVVQANNFREMTQFVEMSLSRGAKRTYFSVLKNWGTFQSKDYLERAVHLPSHPCHQELLGILKDARLRDGTTITLAGFPR